MCSMYNKLNALAHNYLSRFSLPDFALLKICLLSLGVLVGVTLPQKFKKMVVIFSIITFFATYLPLMWVMVKTLFTVEDE